VICGMRFPFGGLTPFTRRINLPVPSWSPMRNRVSLGVSSAALALARIAALFAVKTAFLRAELAFTISRRHRAPFSRIRF